MGSLRLTGLAGVAVLLISSIILLVLVLALFFFCHAKRGRKAQARSTIENEDSIYGKGNPNPCSNPISRPKPSSNSSSRPRPRLVPWRDIEAYFEISVVEGGPRWEDEFFSGKHMAMEMALRSHCDCCCMERNNVCIERKRKNVVSWRDAKFKTKKIKKVVEGEDKEEEKKVTRIRLGDVPPLTPGISAIGFTVASVGVVHPFMLPGCDKNSVGFYSNGSVYVNGERIFGDDPNIKWKHGGSNTMGCGFSLKERAFFFTINGNKTREIKFPSHDVKDSSTLAYDEFKVFGDYPLHPTVASNHDVTIITNFGQSSFIYEVANNPCFEISAHETQGDDTNKRYDNFSISDTSTIASTNSCHSYDIQNEASYELDDLFEISIHVGD